MSPSAPGSIITYQLSGFLEHQIAIRCASTKSTYTREPPLHSSRKHELLPTSPPPHCFSVSYWTMLSNKMRRFRSRFSGLRQDTNVSEVPEDGGSMELRNIGTYHNPDDLDLNLHRRQSPKTRIEMRGPCMVKWKEWEGSSRGLFKNIIPVFA
jgi:hypothetical protein